MRRTKEESEKTRESILCAAEKLFLKKGVARTSLEEIARNAGITRGAVYWHFKNKAHLINELHEQVCLPMEQIAAQLVNIEGSSVEKLYMLILNIFKEIDASEKKRNIHIILLRRCEFTEEFAEVEEKINGIIEEFINQCVMLLNAPESLKQLRPGVTPAFAAQMLHIMLIGVFSDWARNHVKLNNNYQSEKIINTLFQGIFINWKG